MTAASPSFDFRLLDTPAGSLPCIIRGPAHGPQILIVPPLFEEMNRTRALLTGIGRRLSGRGIGSWLPDLPGTGDSALPLSAATWSMWGDSVQAICKLITASNGRRPHLFAVRGGALLADGTDASSRYLLAPVASGERLLRELMRTRLAADQERGAANSLATLEATLAKETVEMGGYPISPALAADLRAATLPALEPTRTAALTGGTGDHLFDGPPVWRQAEPAAAPALACEIADDLAAWIATCAVR